MAKIKLVLADVDGTLVTKEKLLTERAIAAVRKLEDSRHQVCHHERTAAARHADAH